MNDNWDTDWEEYFILTKRDYNEHERQGDLSDKELLNMRRDLNLPTPDTGRYLSHGGCKGKTWVASTRSLVYCTRCGCLL